MRCLIIRSKTNVFNPKINCKNFIVQTDFLRGFIIVSFITVTETNSYNWKNSFPGKSLKGKKNQYFYISHTFLEIFFPNLVLILLWLIRKDRNTSLKILLRVTVPNRNLFNPFEIIFTTPLHSFTLRNEFVVHFYYCLVSCNLSISLFFRIFEAVNFKWTCVRFCAKNRQNWLIDFGVTLIHRHSIVKIKRKSE